MEAPTFRDLTRKLPKPPIVAGVRAVCVRPESPAWDATDSKALNISWPMFGLHDRAHNTVTLMLEYSHPSPMERVYAPVNVLPEDGSEDIACHIVWRIDVSKAKHATRPRSRVLQGYFYDGRWDTEVLLDQTSTGLPVPPSRPFALQITFMRNGYLSYIDGVLQGVTVPPYKLRPADGCTPVVQLPVTGGAGEPSNLRCHGVWVGFFWPPEADLAQLKQRVAAAVHESFEPGHVIVSGMPPDTTRVALWEHFFRFGIDDIILRHSSADIVLKDKVSQETVRAVIQATHRAPFLSGTLQVDVCPSAARK